MMVSRRNINKIYRSSKKHFRSVLDRNITLTIKFPNGYLDCTSSVFTGGEKSKRNAKKRCVLYMKKNIARFEAYAMMGRSLPKIKNSSKHQDKSDK